MIPLNQTESIKTCSPKKDSQEEKKYAKKQQLDQCGRRQSDKKNQNAHEESQCRLWWEGEWGNRNKRERGRDGVKEVKTETTGHGARAEKERKKERQSGLDWDLKIWTSNGVYT